MVCVRKIKKLLTFILALVILAGTVCLPASAAEEITYNSPAAVVTELVSGTTIISQGEDTVIDPGEMVKLVVLYVLASECFSGMISLDDEIIITSDMKQRDTSTIPLQVDEVFTLQDIMYMAYMDYSDTALFAAAIHSAGSVENFVALMNKAAENAGCTNTNFVNITGKSEEGQTTTVADMVAFVKMAIQNSVFMQVFTAVTYSVEETNKSISRSIVTPNLVQHQSSKYGSKYCVGGIQGGNKDNGYATITLSELPDTDETGNNHMELIVITAGAADSASSYADAYNIIDWTFNNFSWNVLVYAGEAIERVDVDMANGTDYVVVGPAEDVTALVDNSIAGTEFDREIIIYPPDEGDTYVAPIPKGTVMGELTVSYNGIIYGRVPLVANQEVRLEHWAYFKSEAKENFADANFKWIIVVVCLMIAAYLVYSALFWYKRIMKKRRNKEIRKQIIAARKEGKPIQAAPVKEKKKLFNLKFEKKPVKEEPVEEVSEEQTDAFDEISGYLEETVEIGDYSEPDISEIADVVNSDHTENK